MGDEDAKLETFRPGKGLWKPSDASLSFQMRNLRLRKKGDGHIGLVAESASQPGVPPCIMPKRPWCGSPG